MVITISTSRLNEICRQLCTNGFLGVAFSLHDGLPLASSNVENINAKVVSAMSALIGDTALRASADLNLSNFESIRIAYEDGLILCRNVSVGNNNYLLSGLSKKPTTEEELNYLEQLMDWAIENSKPILLKLGSL